MTTTANPGDYNDDSNWEEEEAENLAKFLDFLWEDIIKNPDKLEPYTEEMHARAMELIEGVELDEEEWEMES